jgi:hypothetical protein
MGRTTRIAGRRTGPGVLGALLATALLALALSAPAIAGAPPLSIRIEGNHFVNGEGQTIRLLGVNHPSFEYACVDGYGYNDGHMDAADAAAVASWHANAVRVPLNEDCWLGLNGQPNSNGGASPPLTMAGYRQEVESYVADLNAAGIYVILELHWSAPGTKIADGQQPMPDEHSTAFWASVAETFKSNPAVVFDLFNEPFSPADPRSGDDPAHPVSWSCWENGGCPVPYYENNETRTGTIYNAVGMQALVTAIRGTGATQPLMLGGLNFANDLTGWLADRPTDPLHQEAASFHNYEGEGKCDTPACWNSQIAPLAAAVPVVTGEIAQEVCAPTNFDVEYMDWADQHGVGYLAWAWWVLSPQEIAAKGCEAFYLLSGWSGTPASSNGTNLHDHLLALFTASTATASSAASPAAGAVGATPVTYKPTKFRATVSGGGTAVTFRIEASAPCKAAIAGQTVKPFRLGGRKARKLGLGAAHLALNADSQATVTVKLPAKAAGLLRAKGRLSGRYTVTLSGSAAPTTSTTYPVTLKAPKPRHRKH